MVKQEAVSKSKEMETRNTYSLYVEPRVSSRFCQLTSWAMSIVIMTTSATAPPVDQWRGKRRRKAGYGRRHVDFWVPGPICRHQHENARLKPKLKPNSMSTPFNVVMVRAEPIYHQEIDPGQLASAK